MLDALLAEARLRWGLDPSAGLAVVVPERLIATPVEPSVPVLLVPAARLRVAAPEGESAAPSPLPGRLGPAGRDPFTVLGRLYPADHPFQYIQAGRDAPAVDIYLPARTFTGR